MKLSELIQTLQDILDDEGDMEVYLVTQPNYPHKHEIRDVRSAWELAEECRDHDDELDPEDLPVLEDYMAEWNETPENYLVIGEGRWVTYASKIDRFIF